MEYGKIIAITGMPGLYEMLGSKNDGAIVRSLEDKSSKFVSSRIHHFSHLETIEVFTVRDNVNLSEVFLAMQKDGSAVPDGKDAGALRSYFEKVYPELDFTRVYSSDLKKMAKWFEVLQQNEIEIRLSSGDAEDEEAAGDTDETDETGSTEEGGSGDQTNPSGESAKTTRTRAAKAPAKPDVKEAPAKTAKGKAKATADDAEERQAGCGSEMKKAPAKKSAPDKPAPKKAAPKKKK